MKSTETEKEITVNEALGNPSQVVDAAALAVRHLAGNADDYRPVMACVMIQDRWAYAADGFVLGRADLPYSHVKAPEGAVPVEGQAFIPGSVAKVIARKAERLDDERTRAAWFTPEGIAWRQFGGVVSLQTPEITEKFPGTEKIIDPVEARPQQARVSFGVDLMLNALAAIKEFMDGSCGGVECYIGKENEPILMKAMRDDTREITVVLMPLVRPRWSLPTNPPASSTEEQ